MKFTNEQIEYMKNASDHVECLCGGRGYGKTHQLINEMQDKINNLQFKIYQIKELKQNWLDIVENNTLVFDNNNLIEFMNKLENILKGEDK